MTDVLPSLILLFGLPLFLVIVFRANAGALFLAACAGVVLLSSLDPVVVTTASSVLPSEGEAYIRTSVVLLSVVIAGLIFKNSVSGGKLPLHIILSAISGLMLWLVVPVLSGLSWLISVASNNAWITVKDYQALIVATGILLSLIIVHKKAHNKHHTHHGK